MAAEQFVSRSPYYDYDSFLNDFDPRHLHSIREILPPAFQDLHSLEWIKLANNDLKTLHYELMEPVLDSLMHIDLHSESVRLSI